MALQNVRGMEDLTPALKQKHNFIIRTAQKTAELFCFKEISTPLLESTEVFARSLGESSDIVQKEMFTFTDRGSHSLTLRPEGTAGTARWFLSSHQHQNLPLRYFYQGPMFRYERPQKGRLRQFHTIGIEFLGEELPRGDLEILSMAYLFLKNLKADQKTVLEINSIGDLDSRKQYQTALINYLNGFKKTLSQDSRRRLETNPLRILDSKDPEDQNILKSAPIITNFLNKRSLSFFAAITNKLKDLGIPFKQNPLLVRGLDYYNHCVFEFKSKELGAQNTVLGGGRYDHLIETMAGGGPRVPGVGWAAGIERLCLLLEPERLPGAARPIALAPLGEEGEELAQKLAWTLRQEGFKVFHPKASGSLSKKMKRAESASAQYTLIFGPEEIKQNRLSLKNMDTQKQQTVPADQVLKFLKNLSLKDLSKKGS